MAINPIDQKMQTQTLDEAFGLKLYTPQERKGDIISTTGEDYTTEEAKGLVDQGNFISEFINAAYLSGRPPEQVSGELQQQTLKFSSFMENPEYIQNQALTVDEETYDQVQSRVATNYQIAQEIVEGFRNTATEDKSYFGYATDIVDRFILRAPLQTIEDLTARTERKGTEILSAASSMGPQEFREWFQSYAEEVSNEGVLKDENYFAIETLANEVNSLGYDPDKTFNQALGVVDLFGYGQAAKGILRTGKAVTGARTGIGRTAAVKGPEVAANVAVKKLNKVADPETLAHIAPSPTRLVPEPVTTPPTKFSESVLNNTIAQRVQGLYKSGAMGRIVPEDVIRAKASKLSLDIASRVSRPLYDSTFVDEGFGTYVAVARIGKPKDAMPYKPTKAGTPAPAVMRMAKEMGGIVVPVDPTDIRKGFVIEIKDRINVTGLVDTFDTDLNIKNDWVRNTVGRLFNNTWLSSSTARDNQFLATLAQMGGSAQAAIKQAITPELNTLDSLNLTERQALAAVMGELRDGADAVLRRHYTDTEFATKYKAVHPKGEAPSKRVQEAYVASQVIEEADYLLKASARTKRFVERGYKTTIEARQGFFSPAKKVRRQDIPEDAILFNAAGMGKVRKADLDDLDAENVWRLAHNMDEFEYVVTPRSVRTLDPTDVIGYNPGGSRMNPNANYFVVIGKNRLKALMGVFSEKKARLALDQLKTLQRALNDGSITDDIVQANSDWNPSIQTAEDLRKFMKDEGWDFSFGDIAIKGRDDDIIPTEVNGSDAFEGMKVGDYIDNDMRRSDKVLLDFGGGRVYNEDPITSILNQYQNSSFTLANRAYTVNAMAGWVKAAKKNQPGWFSHLSPLSDSDYEFLFKNAKITGNDSFAIRMRELRQITMNRLNIKDEGGASMDAMMQKLSEFVFDVSGGKIEANLGDPSKFLRKVGFQSAFGFFNISQIAMQASQVANILAISPTHAFKAVAHVPAVRNLLRVTDDAARELGIERLAKSAGMSKGEAREWLEYINTSGRAVIDGDAIEDGTGVGFGLSTWGGNSIRGRAAQQAVSNVQRYGGKALDKGLFFFNAGERTSRLSAINTAIFEYRTANPGKSILTDNARQWITRREQDLTFNMDTMSQARFQQGLLGVPTQWLSYSFRVFESVFVGRNFSKAERARLFAVTMPMFGLTGFGMGSFAEEIGEKFGIPADSPMFIGLKHGLIDGLAAWAGVDISLAPRFAAAGALTETWRKITEESTISALFGPSGEISGSILSSLFKTFDNLVNGRDVMLTETAISLLRQPSGLDNIAKAIGIFNNGIYRSKTGTVVEGVEMSVADGITALLGFTPLQVSEFYDAKTAMYNSNKKLADFRKEVNRYGDTALRLMQGDDADKERAIALMDEINTRISLSGFSQRDQASLRKSVASNLELEYNKMIDWAIRTERFYEMQALDAWVSGKK